MSLPTTTDEASIIAAVLAGDVEKFELLVARYRAALFRLAVSRLGCPETADDAVQETLLCAFKSLHSYDSRFSFRTWLWAILLNQCRRHYQKAQRRQMLMLGGGAADEQAVCLAEPVTDDVEPARRLIQKEQEELLHRTLKQLPEAQADALRLRFFGELKFHEIAAVMGCSLSSAKNRVRWGLTKMSHLLAPDSTSSDRPGEVRDDGGMK